MRVLNEEIRASSDAPASFTSIVRERERAAKLVRTECAVWWEMGKLKSLKSK